jgi:deoxyribonuclease-1-like protein
VAKKSKSKKRWGPVAFVWMVITALSGSGISGYLNPNLPVIGPLIQNILSRAPSNPNQPGVVGGQSIFPGKTVSYPQSVGTPSAGNPVQKPNDRIRIGTYNIQVFGTSKIAKPDVMSVIVQTIRQFDIVAIQEIRSKDDTIIPQLIEMLNADGSRYHYLIGPRIGRSVSTEQYAFVYDTNRIEHDPTSVGTVGDPADVLHREPMAARFRPRTNFPDQAFSFWLLNIHTDPDETDTEVSALADVFRVMQTARPDEDDVILLGDLNVDGRKMGRLGQIPGIYWVVQSGTTNTRRTKAYDNIVFHTGATNEYVGRWGVFDVQSVFGLSDDAALKVSDHFPVWAEFGIWEGVPNGHFADRSAEPVR